MSGINFQTTPFNQKVTILDDAKMSLTADPIEGNKPGRAPKLNFSLRGNYPHIRIRLNNGKTKEEGNIDLAIDLLTFMGITVALEDACRSQQPMTKTFAVKRQGFDRNTKRPTEPYIAALVIVGKDRDGYEFIGIQRGQNANSKNYLTLKFKFLPAEFHPVIDQATGQSLSGPEVSNLIARGYTKLLQSLVPLINANVWDYSTTQEGKWAIKNAGNNQQNTTGYTPQYNNQSSQASAPAAAPQTQSQSSSNDNPFDDDIPW